jgi:hypothetical protein
MAQIWEQGRNLERGVYIRGKESGNGRFVPSQVAKPPFPEGLLSDTSLELRQGKLLADPSGHRKYSRVISGPQRAKGIKFAARYIS